jgi:PAS domain S-box-containing protein
VPRWIYSVGISHPLKSIQGQKDYDVKAAKIPSNENLRRAALYDYNVLDTLPEAEFDDLTQIASQICGVPIALISLIDEDRQWFKSKVGLDATQTPRDVAFCAHAILDDRILIVPDAYQDDRFRDNPLTTGEPNVRFYAGAPLRTPGGFQIGTLCVIDHVPRKLTDGQEKALQALARQVVCLLELRRHNASIIRASLLMENSPAAMFCKDYGDEAGVYVEWNKTAEELWGMPKEFILGKSDYDLFSKELAQAYREADLEAMRAQRRKYIEHETLDLPNGGKFDLRTWKVPVGPVGEKPRYMLGISLDITKQKALERELIDAKRRLEEAEITGKFGSWELDLKTMAGSWSKGHNALFEFDESMGNPSFDTFLALIVPEDRHIPQNVLKSVFEEDARDLDIQYRMRLRDGTIRHIKGYGKVITDDKGAPVLIRGTVQDITQLKLLEESLLLSREEALNSAEAKSRFLANISHEIRTPMNGIIGMTNLLLASTSDPQQREKLKIIQSCGSSLLVLIDDVLDFSRIEASGVELEQASFFLHSTVNEVIELLGGRAAEKGLSLTYLPAAGVPAAVVGDVTRFRQVVTNLVSNAIKFTERGAVRISADGNVSASGVWDLRFNVQDTGVGIAEEMIGKLFQPFSQADASTTRRFGGTGLGLAICKGLCEKMGGTISVNSKLGEGSTFAFTFKAPEAPADFEASGADGPQFDAEMGKIFPLRIILAEDNPTNQVVAIGLLEALGYKASIAENGVEALRQLDLGEYDLVLMDCHMPQLDGFETTKRIIERCGSRRPRIIALTASTMKEDIDRCFEAGMDGFIPKPISLSALMGALQSCKPVR